MFCAQGACTNLVFPGPKRLYLLLVVRRDGMRSITLNSLSGYHLVSHSYDEQIRPFSKASLTTLPLHKHVHVKTMI
jgi:hypothetical protein